MGASVVCAALLSMAQAPVRADQIPWSVRSAVGVAMMTSEDQRGRLRYDQAGLVGDLQLAYRFLPWLDAKLGMAGGGFWASEGEEVGGLVAPAAGALVITTHHGLRPYAQLDLGVAFTGALVKPFFRVGGGVELDLSRALAIGPTLGYGRVFQSDLPNRIDSTDAGFLWLGVGLTYRPTRSIPVPPRPRVKRTLPLPPPEPPREVEPSTQLMDLIERTLPSDPSRVELLAPVLFEFDSDQLQPVGTAMLHEVARELEKRPELELVEIQGYADRRGRAEYNRQLSDRRAQCVLEWLVAHGVDRVRLRVAAEGATAFVEKGAGEDAHEQNRRVVFRVIRVREP